MSKNPAVERGTNGMVPEWKTKMEELPQPKSTVAKVHSSRGSHEAPVFTRGQPTSAGLAPAEVRRRPCQTLPIGTSGNGTRGRGAPVEHQNHPTKMEEIEENMGNSFVNLGFARKIIYIVMEVWLVELLKWGILQPCLILG